jgi:two-component system, NtrC family, response regulator GlrR
MGGGIPPNAGGTFSCNGGTGQLAEACAAAGIVGVARSFLSAIEQLSRFALADIPLLIAGETGTGKELFARAAHYLSPRGAGPFVPVNCGALPERLFENELFGHGRGAYTDAREAQRGLIAMAEGGTLLLDEVECLDLHSQAALLRFLQDGHYRPLGAGRDVKADVRIIASSNAVLGDRACDGLFRTDLLFRLNVANVRLPPLRERREDILPLAYHLLAGIAKKHGRRPPQIDTVAISQMLAYDWPGNVRELENVMHRALLLTDDGQPIMAVALGSGQGTPAPTDLSKVFTGKLREERAQLNAAFEREYASQLLAMTQGNITAAARVAGTERRYFGRLVARAGLRASAFGQRGA